MITHRLPLGSFQSNCYIAGLESSRDGVVIDPGDEPETILKAVDDSGLNIRLVIATHGHIDHILAAEAVREATGAPFLIHKGDKPLVDGLPEMSRRWFGESAAAPTVDRWLEEGEIVEAGDLRFRVLYTPGHSWGSVSLYWSSPGQAGIVFTGDALFAGGIGRTDLGGDFQVLEKSIREQLFTLPDDTVVLSGHGGPTTIGRERRTNPWVGEAARPF